uniref:Geranyllinalool synthase 1 n=1 Tax=Tripterygium wilfordii TaxID=458696 RepID=A0A1S5TFB2_TRIWF|nr:geranyllinalool synthase 1 [Tripterygium wilfordii]
MDFSDSSIISLVDKIKVEMFVDMDVYSFVAPSAYDTAWLAMVPDSRSPVQPLFMDCLDWVLNNQREEGFWGDIDGHGMPAIESLTSTLACLIALKKWNVGESAIQKGLDFVRENAEMYIEEIKDCCPRRFAVIFPAMLEQASSLGLDNILPNHVKDTVHVMDIFIEHRRIVEKEELVETYHYPPLLAYLEALPPNKIDKDQIVTHLSSDGSLFQSPSATASAFMITGNKDCLAYLKAIIQRCPNGVPATYPIDEDLIRLCMVNHLQRLGLAEHFTKEIKNMLTSVHRNYSTNHRSTVKDSNLLHLYKDSLAFWLLRMNGYIVSPGSFCWFMQRGDIKDRIENNYYDDDFSSVMLNVYKATDLMFPGEEDQLEEARCFARKLLENVISTTSGNQNHLHKLIGHELKTPWLARLDHLEHKMWITQEHDSTLLWMGKFSFHRLSYDNSERLTQLAVQNYKYRQSIYRKELVELKRWSREWGLSEMGFGREKTTYCYFVVAASTSLPKHSDVRLIAAKIGILITVADDFFDEHASLDELQNLTHAIQRWDGKGLSGHSRTIFEVLDDLVREIAKKYKEQQEGIDVSDSLKNLWYETFLAWLVESQWSKNGHIPSMDEYIETGMISIASHTLLLPASCFLNPSLAYHQLKPLEYENITKLLMLITRLLNDTQSYQKEQKSGKKNFVLLYLKENPEAEIEDAIEYVGEIIEKKKKEFFEYALMDGLSELPKECRHLHLACLKVYQMLFNSSNRYDSNTELIQDIQEAFYQSPDPEIGVSSSKSSSIKSTKKPVSLPQHLSFKKQNNQTTSYYHSSFDYRGSNNIAVKWASWPKWRVDGYNKSMFVTPKFSPCFI